ncbi:Uncharacterized protein PECH_007545 [Penicillium ucsense]|uniref:RRM domain-containing protein n=1 Tax=Penicillium ucsense TaxID=2839758 RepID=A0A8J8W6E3_9EURO|nr:Uncharacterized protein PECM_004441 [Penicillium ucsense]KAF7738843.1 Uncharacterized protein PECH_007545 [Penicillium ucsense]
MAVQAMAAVPRSDRLQEEPSGKNAQGLFPPAACIFVGNLSTRVSPDALVEELEFLFSEFGPCHVKIKQDRKKGLPGAFVQYERVEDAEAALACEEPAFCYGRMLRLEKAKAQRVACLGLRSLQPVTNQDVVDVMANRGTLEDCTIESQQTGLGKWTDVAKITFAYVDDYRDAIKDFHKDEKFYLHPYEMENKSDSHDSAEGSATSTAVNHQLPPRPKHTFGRGGHRARYYHHNRNNNSDSNGYHHFNRQNYQNYQNFQNFQHYQNFQNFQNYGQNAHAGYMGARPSPDMWAPPFMVPFVPGSGIYPWNGHQHPNYQGSIYLGHNYMHPPANYGYQNTYCHPCPPHHGHAENWAHHPPANCGYQNPYHHPYSPNQGHLESWVGHQHLPQRLSPNESWTDTVNTPPTPPDEKSPVTQKPLVIVRLPESNTASTATPVSDKTSEAAPSTVVPLAENATSVKEETAAEDEETVGGCPWNPKVREKAPRLVYVHNPNEKEDEERVRAKVEQLCLEEEAKRAAMGIEDDESVTEVESCSHSESRAGSTARRRCQSQSSSLSPSHASTSRSRSVSACGPRSGSPLKSCMSVDEGDAYESSMDTASMA